MPEDYCDQAARIIKATRQSGFEPVVKSFFDEATNTASHVVHDPVTREAAIIDSVLDYDAASGRTALNSANAIIDYVNSAGLTVTWLLETHAHADHLSAAPYLKTKLGGKIAISRHIVEVQQVFGKLFNTLSNMAPNGSDFEHLFDDGEPFKIGSIEAIAFQSIRRLMTLPDVTRMFLCHDYKAAGRDSFAWETTVGARSV